MPQPTLQNVRPIDPVLTGLSIGFRNGNYIWESMAPVVRSSEQSGTYFTWTRDFWFRRQSGGVRAPSNPYTRVGIGVGTDTFRCLERGFEEPVSEVVLAASQTPDSLDIMATQHLTELMQLELEKDIAAATFVTGVWGTSSTLTTINQWSDYANSDPIANFDTAKRTIRRNTGQEPNMATIGALTWEILKEHPLILDKYKHTQTGIMTKDLVAAALGIPTLNIGTAIENTAVEGQSFSGADIWTDNCFIGLMTPTPGLYVPNTAYTFMWDEKGNIPWAVDKYEERQTRSMVNRIFTHYQVEITSAQCGFLFIDTNA
jgi:hypothetical protein